MGFERPYTRAYCNLSCSNSASLIKSLHVSEFELLQTPRGGNLILAGNFNITNNEDLFGSLVQLGQHPRELSDTVTLLEKIGHFVDKENNDLYVKYSAAGHSPQTCFSLIAENINIARILRRASSLWDGGYCIAGLLGHGDAFVMRDPSGIRPAFYYADDEFIVVCSEAPLIQTVFNVNGDHVHPLPPGQALCIKRSGAWTLDQILALRPQEAWWSGATHRCKQKEQKWSERRSR